MSFFIAVEGADGSGKSAQVRHLVERFEGLGYETVTDPAHVLFSGGRPCVLATREPSDGPVGKLIRQALRGEVELSAEAMGYLYAADRRDHLARVVQPALEGGLGSVVITDRYGLSNRVYRLAEMDDPLFMCPTCGWEGDEGDEPAAPHACPDCGFLEPVRFTPAAEQRATWARGLDHGLLVPDLTIVLAVSAEVAAARRRARGGGAERYDGGRMQARCCALYRRAVDLGGPGEQVAVVDGEGTEEAVADRVWAAVVTPDQRWAQAGDGNVAVLGEK
jgi:dTMP kinase